MQASSKLSAVLKTVTGQPSLMSKAVNKLTKHLRMNYLPRHLSSGSFHDDGNDWEDPGDLRPDSNQRHKKRVRDETDYFALDNSNSEQWRSQSRRPRIRQPYSQRRDDFDFETKDYEPWQGHSQRPRFRQPYRQSEDDFDFETGEFRPQRNRSLRRDFDFDDEMGGSRNDSFFDPRSRLGGNLKTHDWSSKQMEPVEKNFYVEHPDVKGMSEEELSAFYATHDIVISKGDMVKPILDFQHANFSDSVNKYMSTLSWSAPTPIQSIGWPIALSGNDMVGVAQTGSGKTLGFVLPALVHVKHQRKVAKREGPVVLVLAPTRELAQQIKSVCAKFGRIMGIQSVAIFGGQSKMVQTRYLAEGPEIVVATPGRLLDFLDMGVTSLERTTYLVLDEADRMLDMGFEPQIRKILSQIRPDRQMLLWSATWPLEVQQLARDFVGHAFTQINVGSAQLMANPKIQQDVIVCTFREKFGILLDELEQMEGKKTLIFVQTKRLADILTHKLVKSRYRALALHGDKTQVVRDKTMYSFKTGKVQIVVATDVASRGLDVNDIELVVNFDYPKMADDYIHRIGRTARAHKSGRALTLLTDEDSKSAKDLIEILTTAGQPVPDELLDLSDLHRKMKSGKRGFKPRGFRQW